MEIFAAGAATVVTLSFFIGAGETGFMDVGEKLRVNFSRRETSLVFQLLISDNGIGNSPANLFSIVICADSTEINLPEI